MKMSRRSGIALSELVIATLILSAALIPMVSVFTRGKMRATMSKLQYIALVAARAELEELRQIEWEKIQARAHPFRPLTGHVFAATVAANGTSARVAADHTLDVPAEYARIETELSIQEVPVQRGPSQLRRAILKVRWQENGDGATRSPEALSQLETLLASHKQIQGVR